MLADLVGDLVGDIAGMSADLFGSFAEATVSALVLASRSSLGSSRSWTALCFPLLISSVSLLVCMLTTLLATDLAPARTHAQIGPSIKVQLVLSAILMAIIMLPVTLGALPVHIRGVFAGDPDRFATHWDVYGCLASGLASGLATGLVTEHFTSPAFTPVRDVAAACKTGAATSIIMGLALGYKASVIPVLLIAGTLLTSFQLAGFYGVSIAALGVLGTLSTTLTIDVFGPIADNAGGIAELSHMGEEVRDTTGAPGCQPDNLRFSPNALSKDALDAAGNTTAAIGKGFAIGSAALVGSALFGGFVIASRVSSVDASLLDVRAYAGLIVGAVLPYLFSAMTLSGVGKAAMVVVEETRRQFRTIAGLRSGQSPPEYSECVRLCTEAALSEMLLPGILTIGTPLLTGLMFGVRSLAGLLTGILASGVPMAISAACSGGAWDNAKKHLEAGATDHVRPCAWRQCGTLTPALRRAPSAARAARRTRRRSCATRSATPSRTRPGRPSISWSS